MKWDYPPPPESLKIEKAPRELLDRIQSAGLRTLVRRSWDRIPFYRERWDKQGLRPEDISGIEDLRKLPVVSKQDFEESLRLFPPFGNYQGDFPPVRIQASSGTSGNPKPFFFTQNDWEIIGRLWARRLYAQGVRQGDIFQVVFAYTLFIVGFTASEGAMRLGALVVPTGSGVVTPSERQVRIAKDWGATVLAGTPSYTLHLADVAEKLGLDTRSDFRFRIMVHTSEPLTDSSRRAIEERWGVQSYDNFGSVETGAPSFECEEKNGYHINEDGYIFEVLDPESYQSVGPGQDGVLVVTCLFKEAAPVIRYNLEDISSFLEGPCPCGRTLRRIAKIKGRTNEMLKIRGIPFYPSAVETALEKLPELTREYFVIVDRVGQQDRVTVQVEWRQDNNENPFLKEKLEHELKVTTGLTMDAALLPPGELSGSLRVEERIKTKRVWDRRNLSES
ncbi:MAG: AMP-binding protein [Candidatus Binatia bacterium]|jgi:phenylacetate-CoA ligase|nr:AMP-binding protein [Candidatus Binatia bacterium]